MSKKFNKYAVIIITILLSELISAYLLSFFIPYKSQETPYRSVAITMLVAVAIFYPAFEFINKYVKKASNKYMNKTSKLPGGSFIGRLIGFFIALFLIFMALAQVLYNRNIIEDIRLWISSVL